MKFLFKLGFTFLLVGAIIFIACSDDKDSSSGPKIVGCNKVEYKGHTFTINGCGSGGVSAFDIERGELDEDGNWVEASFSITCSGSCIATVKELPGGLGKTIVGPQ